MSEAQTSEAMKNLVKFMVCLAILGSVIALTAYVLVALPGQVPTPLSNLCTHYHTIFGDWVTCR